MKLILVGANVHLPKTLLKQSKSHNKFGSLYYLQEKFRIYSTKAINEYNVWESDEGKSYLCIRNNAQEWKNEIDRILMEVMKQNDEVIKEIKLQKDDEVYIKIDSNLARSIPQKHNLYITVDAYAVFVQNNTARAFLQMEVISYTAEPLAFDMFVPETTNE